MRRGGTVSACRAAGDGREVIERVLGVGCENRACARGGGGCRVGAGWTARGAGRDSGCQWVPGGSLPTPVSGSGGRAGSAGTASAVRRWVRATGPASG